MNRYRMVLFVVVALLMAAAPMSAQPVSCVDVGGWTYKGQHHNQYPDGTWGWLTIDFRDKGVPWDDGICILDALAGSCTKGPIQVETQEPPYGKNAVSTGILATTEAPA